ncbi:MAG: hypothetical protein ACRDQ4_26795 [Pseudonocardiaceae bacterium]
MDGTLIDDSSLKGHPGRVQAQSRDATAGVPQRLYTIPMTALLGTRLEHEVTDDAFAAGQAAGRGEFQALCGPMFIPAAMVAPPGRPCPECLDILAASRRASASAAPRRPRHRRPGLLRRLLLVCQQRRASTGRTPRDEHRE